MMLAKRLAPVVVASLVLAGCGGGGNQAAGGTPIVTYIQVTPPSMVFYPGIVGQELGFFKAENVIAKMQVASEGVAGTTYLSNGNADLAMTDVDKIIIAVSKGGDFQSPYSAQYLNTIGIVVPNDSGIQDFNQIEGKTVGFASSENFDLFLALLDNAGIPQASVKKVVVGSSGALLVTAFQQGQIDAYVGGTLDFVKISASGYTLRPITPKYYAAIDGNPFAVLPETLQQRRTAIVSFLRAWAEAQYLGYVRPKVVEAIVRKNVPLEWSNVAAGHATLQQSIKSMTLSDPKRMGDLRLDSWQSIQDLMVKAGILQSPIDLTSVLNSSLIAEVNNFDRAKVVQAADNWAQQNTKYMNLVP